MRGILTVLLLTAATAGAGEIIKTSYGYVAGDTIVTKTAYGYAVNSPERIKTVTKTERGYVVSEQKLKRKQQH